MRRASRRNILKILIVTTVATFTVLTHNKAIQQQKEIRLQKAMNFKYKTEKQRYDEVYKMWIKPSQEKKVKELEEQKKKQNNLSRGNLEEETFILTFYSSLNSENGYGAITCEGKKLRDGMVANNVFDLGTNIQTKEFGTLTVSDRGGNNFNTRNRLDVFVPRNHGESDYKYQKRVENMGKIKIKGYIIK